MPNLIITYDLPSGNYDAVEQIIKIEGTWAKLATTTFFVPSSFDAPQMRDRIIPVLGLRDRLAVVNASNNQIAWHNQPQEAIDVLNACWK